jgi:hypothetical protein
MLAKVGWYENRLAFHSMGLCEEEEEEEKDDDDAAAAACCQRSTRASMGLRIVIGYLVRSRVFSGHFNTRTS